ncbi:MAG: DUF4124 domain-containing protein [Woeseiaceae bacterium]|nr:DUF4124 domain-containing protein [Woeseiaceae bacterium]
MDSRPILLFASLLATGVVFAEAYRWVDEDGVVHYSDRPAEGAEEIVLPKANTTAVRRYQRDEPAQQPQQPQNQPVRYQDLSISYPAPEETLWNIEGQLTVQIQVTPALQPGHRMRLYFDGEGQDISSTSVQLEEVWRGEHNLQVEILNETGMPLIRSNPLRFYVQQSTVNF